MEYLEASVTGVLRMIIILVIIYLLVRLVKMLLPVFLRTAPKNRQKKDTGSYIYKDGVKINLNKGKKKNKDDEYTDYEIIE
jgi:uncharacterized protein HemY